MGDKLRKFDGAASAAEVARQILRERRNGELGRYEAREIYDEFASHFGTGFESNCGSEVFAIKMLEMARVTGDGCSMHDFFADPNAWPIRYRPDERALLFWERLWPEFVEELKKDLGC